MLPRRRRLIGQLTEFASEESDAEMGDLSEAPSAETSLHDQSEDFELRGGGPAAAEASQWQPEFNRIYNRREHQDE